MNKTNFKPPKNKNDLTGLLANVIQNKKVTIFIDGANLYFAASVANLRVDYKQIYKWFDSKCYLSRLNYYTAFDPDDQKQQDFLEDMEKTGYRIIKKPIKVYENFTKGNMDIELAVDALMQKDEYEVLVLISGDGDFRYLVKALEAQGKTSIVIGIGGFTSFELHQEADNYFFLNRISKVWQSQRKSKIISENFNLLDQSLVEDIETAQTNIEVESDQTNNPKKTIKITKPPVKLKVKTHAKSPKIFLS